MNLPNKLTVLRLVLVPVFFILFVLVENTAFKAPLMVIMLICYAVAELTDLLDGKIARGHGLVTDLGKVMDPFADTLTHVTYFLCFLYAGIMPLWAFIIIMWREFSIQFVRLLMAKFAGKAMPANIFGKAKTVLYAFTTLLSFVYLALGIFISGAESIKWYNIYSIILTVFFGLSAFSSLMSFLIYVKDVIKSKSLEKMTR